MKRVVFLDYVRVFACFLVMLVHASENFYGAPGSTDMVGPQALLNNETDRLHIRWIFKNVCSFIYDCLGISSCSYES